MAGWRESHFRDFESCSCTRQLGSLQRLPAGNSDRPGSDCWEPDGAILRTPQAVVKEIVGENAEKWIERANDRDQVIAEWLKWLCDNGSVFGRC